MNTSRIYFFNLLEDIQIANKKLLIYINSVIYIYKLMEDFSFIFLMINK